VSVGRRLCPVPRPSGFRVRVGECDLRQTNSQLSSSVSGETTPIDRMCLLGQRTSAAASRFSRGIRLVLNFHCCRRLLGNAEAGSAEISSPSLVARRRFARQCTSRTLKSVTMTSGAASRVPLPTRSRFCGVEWIPKPCFAKTMPPGSPPSRAAESRRPTIVDTAESFAADCTINARPIDVAVRAKWAVAPCCVLTQPLQKQSASIVCIFRSHVRRRPTHRVILEDHEARIVSAVSTVGLSRSEAGRPNTTSQVFDVRLWHRSD